MSEFQIDPYADAPADALMDRCRRFLARYLDPPTNALSDDLYPQYWRGLAELMGCYNWHQLQEIERKERPTMELLEQWTRNKGSTVGKLWDLLEKLGMYSITQDEQFQKILSKWLLTK